VGARLTDSSLYAHLWGTDELRAVFDERARIASWLEILAALAESQAELGLVPATAAEAIAREAKVESLDLAFVAAETRRTGHSTLGLIRDLQRVLPEEAAEWVYYGTTVQDLTDTWTALAIKAVGRVAWRDVRALEASALDLARTHRGTVMAGRTHGQSGSPITFGLKAAGWADELRRHLDRLREGAPRWLVGQLAGATGNLGFFGRAGPELRQLFCHRLGLGDPGISWTTSRDRVVEFVHVLAMVASTLGRIGSEVYELQRTEIGELREAASTEGVGSITMPHKRNPETSEHLVTLSRLVRAQHSVLLEGLIQEHERDGRGWKAEWVAFPEACLLAGASLAFGRSLLEGLEVDEAAMRRNLEASGFAASERLLSALAPVLGKHRAQARLQELLATARSEGIGLEEAVRAADDVREALDASALADVFGPTDGGSSVAMVDAVLARAEAARAVQDDDWP
jgi:adenylosuccinate lyase